MFERKRIIRKELEELLKEGRIVYVPHKKMKFGRWILKEKIGDFIGCKGEAKSEN